MVKISLLQALTDGFDLQPALTDASRRVDQLQVIDDDQAEGAFVRENADEPANLFDVDVGVRDEERQRLELLNRLIDRRPVMGRQVTLTQCRGIHGPGLRQQPHADRHLQHLARDHGSLTTLASPCA